eukprot:jgi/Mesvir1/14812/Mv05447-RA.2
MNGTMCLYIHPRSHIVPLARVPAIGKTCRLFGIRASAETPAKGPSRVDTIVGKQWSARSGTEASTASRAAATTSADVPGSSAGSATMASTVMAAPAAALSRGIMHSASMSSFAPMRPAAATPSMAHVNQPKAWATPAIAPESYNDIVPGFGPWRNLSEFTGFTEIGHGRLSVVWAAKCRRTGLTFAVKKYMKHAVLSSPAAEAAKVNIHREVAVLQSLRGIPSVCHLYGTFEDAEGVYLVQEYCPWGDLLDVLKEFEGQMPEQILVPHVLAPLLKCLQHVHDKGIIHRDVKPENIFIDGAGHPRLGDFGLGVTSEEHERMQRVGTLDYMAPEVLIGPTFRRSVDSAAPGPAPYTHKVDTWAVGILAYEMLMGHAPFEVTNSETDTVALILWADIPVQGAWPAHVSPEAISFITWALRKVPDARPSAADMLRHPWVIKYCPELAKEVDSQPHKPLLSRTKSSRRVSGSCMELTSMPLSPGTPVVLDPAKPVDRAAHEQVRAVPAPGVRITHSKSYPDFTAAGAEGLLLADADAALPQRHSVSNLKGAHMEHEAARATATGFRLGQASGMPGGALTRLVASAHLSVTLHPCANEVASRGHGGGGGDERATGWRASEDGAGSETSCSLPWASSDVGLCIRLEGGWPCGAEGPGVEAENDDVAWTAEREGGFVRVSGLGKAAPREGSGEYDKSLPPKGNLEATLQERIAGNEAVGTPKGRSPPWDAKPRPFPRGPADASVARAMDDRGAPMACIHGFSESGRERHEEYVAYMHAGEAGGIHSSFVARSSCESSVIPGGGVGVSSCPEMGACLCSPEFSTSAPVLGCGHVFPGEVETGTYQTRDTMVMGREWMTYPLGSMEHYFSLRSLCLTP